MGTNVFVKFLPSHVDDGLLHKMFSPYGSIVSCKVMVSPSSGESLGFGFVRYTKSEEASRAIAYMTGYKMGSKTLLCKLSDCFNVSGLAKSNLYIKPLPTDYQEDQLAELFGRFGNIVALKIGNFAKKSDSNIGFVRYENVESASNAIQVLNGILPPGFSHPITVKYAKTDDQNAARKESPKTRNIPLASYLPPTMEYPMVPMTMPPYPQYPYHQYPHPASFKMDLPPHTPMKPGVMVWYREGYYYR